MVFVGFQYPLDRVGQCVFHLWHSKNKIAHTIRFNTTYESQEQESWLGSLYSKIYPTLQYEGITMNVENGLF